MNKDLIKQCQYCGKYYYANQPHFEKSLTCSALEEMMMDFIVTNKVPPYEIYRTMIGIDDHFVSFQYDHEQTLKNFMRLVYDKLFTGGK